MEEKSKLEISELFELWDILHSQIKELCHDQSDNLSYSKLSKLPFKTITIVYSMAWRLIVMILWDCSCMPSILRRHTE